MRLVDFIPDAAGGSGTLFRGRHSSRCRGRPGIAEQCTGHGSRARRLRNPAVVFGHNEASMALLESAGFERWGHLPGVTQMPEGPRDVVILGWKRD